MQPREIKPRYEVRARPGVTVTERRIRRIETNPERGVGEKALFINEDYEVEVPYGYDVYFPRGHSIRIATEAELRRLGYHNPADLIDMETGDSVGTVEPQSLERSVMRRAAASRRRADTGGIDANQGD